MHRGNKVLHNFYLSSESMHTVESIAEYPNFITDVFRIFPYFLEENSHDTNELVSDKEDGSTIFPPSSSRKTGAMLSGDQHSQKSKFSVYFSHIRSIGKT